MDSRYRRPFNEQIDERRYEEYQRELTRRLARFEFRLAESPLFLPDDFKARTVEASEAIVAQLSDPANLTRMKAAIPARWDTPGMDALPSFTQVDFAVVREPDGTLVPKLIELQGFPSLTSMQCVQRDVWNDVLQSMRGLEGEWSCWFSGLDRDGFLDLARRTIVGGHDPSEVILMDDKALQAVRAKRDSSMRVGLRLVREGRAAAFITAGNTGAAMATAKMVLGGLPGVDRPALVAIMPTATRTVTALLDVGANVDCKPHNLEQFAVMGDIYFRSMFGTERPRVGLLSIGEEEGKGNELTREAFQLLKQLPLNFIGNVEGRDIYGGKVDVIVADGFVGNVALKTSEGVVNLVRATLKETLRATITRQVGFLLSRSAFSDFKKRLDHTEYGGAPLLGVKGACFITHGSSNVNAIKNAIRVASEFVERDINRKIESEVAKTRPVSLMTAPV